jgi:hypothetical protein
MIPLMPSWPARAPAYGQVVLRPFADRDVPMVMDLATDPYLPLIGSLPAHADAEPALAFIERQRGRLAEGAGLSFAIADASNRRGRRHDRAVAARPGPPASTNVRPSARTRMIAWARQHGRPVAVLRFRVAGDVLVRRNSARSGPARVPADGVRHYAAIAARQTSRDQLLAEGATVVVDVPGEAEGFSPARAAAAIHLS